MGLKDILTIIDIFGAPFEFEMGIGKNRRQTIFGGILSIVLLFAALLYFIYLNYNFANGLIQPKITQQQIQFKTYESYTVDSSFIWFDQQNVKDGTFLMDHLQTSGLSLVKYSAVLKQSDSNGIQLPVQTIPLDFCEKLTNSPSVPAKAQCFDFSGIAADQRVFKYFPTKGYDTKIVVSLQTFCDVAASSCASTHDQLEYVFGSDWTFNLYIQELQYDTKAASFISKIDVTNWDFDPTLTTISTVSLKTSKTTVKDGFLIQKPQDYYYYSDSTSKNSFKTRGSAAKVDPLAVFEFTIKLDQTQFQDVIQYAQYPEVLAQFGSIVNVILIIGIIGIIVARADIQQYFIDQKLKEYYRQTAYKILKSDSKSLSEQEKPLQNISGKVTKDQVLKIMKEIDSKDMNDELKKKMNISTIGNIIKTLIGEQKEDYMKKKRGNKDIFETLYFESSKCQDIFELQSDLMKMKKIIAMLITPEQYAAIKCCGSSISDQIPFLLGRTIETKKSQVGSESESENKLYNEIESQSLMEERILNHIELIDKIDYDEAYFQHKLDQFFKKSENNFSGEDDYNMKINQRLMVCLNKTYGDSNQTNCEIFSFEKSKEYE